MTRENKHKTLKIWRVAALSCQDASPGLAYKTEKNYEKAKQNGL